MPTNFLHKLHETSLVIVHCLSTQSIPIRPVDRSAEFCNSAIHAFGGYVFEEKKTVDAPVP